MSNLCYNSPRNNTMSTPYSISAQQLVEAARELGLEAYLEPQEYVGMIKTPSGSPRYFRASSLDLNTMGAAALAQDKDYTSHFLARAGYPAPVGEAFFSDEWAREMKSAQTPEAAVRYANTLDFPLIIKPNARTHGVGVEVVRSANEAQEAIARAAADNRVYLVQKYVPGHDYRLFVLDGIVLAAYQRRALHVVGDNLSTIQELLVRKIALQKGTGRTIRVDPQVMVQTLAHQKLTIESIPMHGVTVQVLPTANLSSGGEAIDLTDTLHDEWRVLAKSIAREMNLRLVGIDIMTKGTLAKPPRDYTVIEVNASPGLTHFASLGGNEALRTKNIYRALAKALVNGDAQESREHDEDDSTPSRPLKVERSDDAAEDRED